MLFNAFAHGIFWLLAFLFLVMLSGCDADE
jgi:hypothetical protein